MVVAQIVKIRNNTLRTICITPGDYFFTPCVDGKPVPSGPIELHPGFDQTTEGLTVPWQSMTSSGLEVFEVDSDDRVWCSVGPVESDDENHDWLQLRSANGEPVAQDRWSALGNRHLLGTVGNSVEYCLTFRETKSSATKPSPLCELIHFDNAMKSAPVNAVFLNVFDLASALSVPNSILCNTAYNTLGAFHAAIEVYGEEWAFYRTPNPTSCGVCRSLRVRHHPVHSYRQSIYLGKTQLKDWEVRYLIRGKLATRWPGGTYDLLRRNCIHFCEELSLALGVAPVPSWVRALHETGASILRVPWPLTIIRSLVNSCCGPRALGEGPPTGALTLDDRTETASDTSTDLTALTALTSTAYRSRPLHSPPASGAGEEDNKSIQSIISSPVSRAFAGSPEDHRR